jgi:integrase
VHVFLIVPDSQEGKRVKTEAGERFIPVHPELERIGFLNYVAQMRRGHSADSRLFPDVTESSTGYLSNNFSKYFARFLDSVGITHKRKSFHSFRHTFRDALRETDIPLERVCALSGWSIGGTHEAYGIGHRAGTLAKEMAKVSFSGLDLSHLCS